MLYSDKKFWLKKDNMALCSNLRVTFFCIAGTFFLLVLSLEIWQKKWKRLVLDIFVYFIQMPLWLISGIAVLKVFPELIYSYFSGMWLIFGIFLWLIPHSISAVKAIRRKNYFDMAYAFSAILSIIFFCIYISGVWQKCNVCGISDMPFEPY